MYYKFIIKISLYWFTKHYQTLKYFNQFTDNEILNIENAIKTINNNL